MTWLNYHHLYYFWMVAKEGTVTAACERLRLAQPTISAQIRRLEKSLGHKLFRPAGRRLELTDTGRLVYRYANDIFELGNELLELLAGRPAGEEARLRVGIADVLPKMVVSRVLSPALAGPEKVHLICFEGKPNELLAKLSIHELDLVLSDSPIPPDVNLRAYNHELGECGVTIFGTPRAAAKYRRKFPASLHGAPILLPTANTSIRRRLDFWFSANGIYPQILAEFEDSALLKAFAQDGDAAFVAPEPIAAEVERQYRVRRIATLPRLAERFYAITVERRLRHPGVLAISTTARERLFSPPAGARRRARRASRRRPPSG